MRILIINGPNLNLLGKRQTEIYGSQSFEPYLEKLKKEYAPHALEYMQSNHEGELIDAIQRAEGRYDGILLNAGAYTHTSIALADTIRAVTVPVVEVHLTNIFAREGFRHVSMIAPHCKGIISGFGLKSYRLALESLLNES